MEKLLRPTKIDFIFCRQLDKEQYERFNKWLRSFPDYRENIKIAINEELCFPYEIYLEWYIYENTPEVIKTMS